MLYGNYNIIEVYSLQGEYQRSFAVKSAKNDNIKLYRNENTVLLKGKGEFTYQFRDGLFEKKSAFDEKILKESFKDDTRKRTALDGTEYQTRWASVICKASDGSKKTVIDRPFIYVFANDTLLIILLGLLVVGLIAAICISRADQRTVNAKITSS